MGVPNSFNPLPPLSSPPGKTFVRCWLPDGGGSHLVYLKLVRFHTFPEALARQSDFCALCRNCLSLASSGENFKKTVPVNEPSEGAGGSTFVVRSCLFLLWPIRP